MVIVKFHKQMLFTKLLNTFLLANTTATPASETMPHVVGEAIGLFTKVVFTV